MPVSNPKRKLLEAALKTVADAMPIEIEWPNLGFDRSLYTEYARFSFHDPVREARTLGRNPRMQTNGFVKIGVFTRSGISSDRGDEIVGEQGTVVDASTGSGLLKAYPYPAALSRDGVSLEIGASETGSSPVEVDGWWYQSVQVPWTSWR